MGKYYLINRSLQDLNPITAGSEVCVPGHSFGPAVRKYTLIHFVFSGSGSYTVGGRTYPVHAGEAFRILPGEMTTYCADLEDPWSYCWIGFDGALSHRFAELPPVFSVSGELFRSLTRDGELAQGLEYRIAADLFRLYAEVFSSKSSGHHYVRRVRDYVRASYMQEVRVERIAAEMNLDRRYLSRLFKVKTGQTIQEYLISVRMEEAQNRLEGGASVSETARLCGYEDVCNFSKMFKKRFGVSPAHWKKAVEEKERRRESRRTDGKIRNDG